MYYGRASGFDEGVFGVATALLGRGPRSRRRWRFLKRSAEGQTWLFEVEMTHHMWRSKTDRRWSFAGSVLPAPLIGSAVGGPSLSAKCIIVAALAAAQSAYFLAQAERVLARATEAVALKARSAAVCDT